MYLNGYILQEIYQSQLVTWFESAFICFMTTLNCNIQLYLPHPHSALWCLANEFTDTSPNPGPLSLLSQKCLHVCEQ